MEQGNAQSLSCSISAGSANIAALHQEKRRVRLVQDSQGCCVVVHQTACFFVQCKEKERGKAIFFLHFFYY